MLFLSSLAVNDGYKVSSCLFCQVVQNSAPAGQKELNCFFLFSSFFPRFSNVTVFFRVLAMNSEKGLYCQLWVQINGFVLIHWVIGNISSNKAFCLACANWPRWIKDLLYHLLRRAELIVNIFPWCHTMSLKKNWEVRAWPDTSFNWMNAPLRSSNTAPHRPVSSILRAIAFHLRLFRFM